MDKSILILSSRADFGGGPRHIELLLKELNENFEFHVACPEEPPYWDRFLKIVENRIIRLPHRKISLNSSRSLLRYINDNGIDLIHSHGKGAGLFAKIIKVLTGKKWIHTPHGIHVDQYNWSKKNLYRLYENIFLSNPDRIIFVSEEERRKAIFERLWQKIPFDVIPNGVPVISSENRKLLRSYGRCFLGLTDQDKVVVTLSRFDYQKNMKEAYLIAKSLPEVKFVWVGDGPERSELIDKIRQDNIKNILLVDFCDDPTPYLAAANIYLTTSRWEGLPLSILESMSLGVPIVASDVVGHREVVGINCTGILYSLGKSEKAVEAIKKLLENDDINLFIKNSAFLVHSSFYSTKIMGERILEVYQKAL